MALQSKINSNFLFNNSQPKQPSRFHKDSNFEYHITTHYNNFNKLTVGHTKFINKKQVRKLKNASFNFEMLFEYH